MATIERDGGRPAALGNVLDGCLWLHRVESGVHRRYLEHLGFLARCIDELSPADQTVVKLLLDREELINGNDQ